MGQKTDYIRDTMGSIIWGTHSRLGHTFDYVMIALIIASMVALTVQTMPGFHQVVYDALNAFELGILLIFTAEYVFRIWTTENRWRYITSFWGLVDLIAILPFWLMVGGLYPDQGSGHASRVLRLLRLLRLLKLLRYLAAIDRLKRAFELVWRELLMFGMLAVLMIYLSAVGIYQFEHAAQPEVFSSIPASMWFAVVTLTTVGYGDITPITLAGKIFTGGVLFIGLGIVAVPTGLIASGLTQAREEEKAAKAAKALEIEAAKLEAKDPKDEALD